MTGAPGTALLRSTALLAVAVALAAACAAPGSGDGQGAGLIGASPVPTGPSLLPSRETLIHPEKKYFGVIAPAAPGSLKSVQTIAAQTGKTPNLVEYFSDWTRGFNAATARTACNAGIVPALTWESWSWENVKNGTTAYSQPAYAPRRIAAGAYDKYITTMAESIKSLGCPIMLRFDQEPNGHWYPWGMATVGMHNTPAQYVAMWRHVWGIFQSVGADNVIWVWSPNLLYPNGVNELSALYPGSKYVDMVGIDGYLVSPTDTPASVFGTVLTELRGIVPDKPWMLSETGAATGSHQSAQITALLHTVASSPRLVGLVYLDQQEHRANWTFSTTPASTQAFRAGIDVPSFAAAPAVTS